MKKVIQKKRIARDIRHPVVGIGASAGGLETLETFFSTMPPDSNMVFVVIQHLSPQHDSIMASLLAKHTRMDVQQIEDGVELEPNHVYLNPPGKNVAVFKNRLQLMELMKGSTINMPVDFFFRSLAEDQGENAIGIILSGTASDGSLGIKSIKGEGGMIMVQEPDTAKYDGMPKNAIKTGLADFILPVEKMPENLFHYLQNPVFKSLDKISLDHPPVENQMQKLFSLIRSATGHDFSNYKRNTIARRTERRLAVHKIKKISDYILYLQKNPAEIEVLFKNLIIGVTSFFRDPEAYEILEDSVIPKLLNDKKRHTSIRFWIAGCSTGEEAYSLAIILTEAMVKAQKHFDIQIFATDIDGAALDTARRGVFPESIATDVSQERLQQFFIREEDGFLKITKQIRDMVIFSVQNIIKDPPFSNLDMVSCRNLMIYMNSVLQKKIIPLFHYTLNHEGILFLGTSESIGDFTDLFERHNFKWKIFKRKSASTDSQISYVKKRDYGVPGNIVPNEINKEPKMIEVQAIVEREIIDAYAPAGVLVNDQYEIMHFVGKTDRYLVPPTGKPSFNILKMARREFIHPLTSALYKSVKKGTDTFCKDIRIEYNGAFHKVDISVKQMSGKGLPSGHILVLFQDKTPLDVGIEKKSNSPKKFEKDPTVLGLEQELESTKEYLQATIEELETSNEELKSTNEEMQSVNEELQSTNEELETSKEELQSTNEELATVNVELQHKVEEFSKTNNDMNNLLAATEIASIFLDTDICIKRYTPAAANIINLIPTDIGRPLNDLTTRHADVDLVSVAKQVLKDLNTLELEIFSKDGVWYSVKVMPYRTSDNVIGGVVMTYVDVTKVKKADQNRRLATVLADSNDAVAVLDLTGNIRAWNKGARDMYGWTETEALEMNIKEVVPEDQMEKMNSVVENIAQGNVQNSFTSQRKTKNGNILDVWLTITVLKDDNGRPKEIATTERDLAWLDKNKG